MGVDGLGCRVMIDIEGENGKKRSTEEKHKTWRVLLTDETQ